MCIHFTFAVGTALGKHIVYLFSGCNGPCSQTTQRAPSNAARLISQWKIGQEVNEPVTVDLNQRNSEKELNLLAFGGEPEQLLHRTRVQA